MTMGLLTGVRRRRLLFGFSICIAIYLFIKHLPTDVPRVADRYDSRTGIYQGRYIPGSGFPEQSELPADDSRSVELHSDGEQDEQVKLDSLTVSLREYIYSGNQGKDNVVFLLHDVKSAFSILSLACAMAIKQKNAVHVAVMVLSDAPVEAIVQVNGIDLEACPIFIHDARPERIRNLLAKEQIAIVRNVLGNIGSIIQPKVILSNARSKEDPIFYDTLHEKAASLQVPVKMLLTSSIEAMSWIINLGALSLAQIDNLQIDILIDASTASAGSLTRLLQSLTDADYTGLQIPRLTIELPTEEDGFVLQYLRTFKWPSKHSESGSKLTLRRSIDSGQQNSVVTARRILESFYPEMSSASHVLVLSSDTELSPNYLHYAMFMLLEYKYSTTKSSLHDRLFGISLELPQKSSDDQAPFQNLDEEYFKSLVLSQRPASNAVLYFGDRWIDFHQFLSKLLLHDPTLSKSVTGHAMDVASRHPSWLRQALEFMKARGLYIMYPTFAADARFTLATVHESTSKDGYESDAKSGKPGTYSHELEPGPEVLGDDAKHDKPGEHVRMSEVEPLQSLLDHLINNDDSVAGTLPRDIDLPLYSHEGDRISIAGFQAMTIEAANQFSLTLGGCSSLDDRKREMYGSVDYLFCEPG